MKGTISPQLKAILANPATSKAFQQGFFDRDRSKPTSIIDLGNGEKVTVRNFWADAPKRRRTSQTQERPMIFIKLSAASYTVLQTVFITLKVK